MLSWDPSLTNRGEPVGEQMNKLIPAAGGNRSHWDEKRARVTCSAALAAVVESWVDRERWTAPLLSLIRAAAALQRLAAGTSSVFLPRSPSLSLLLLHTHLNAQGDAFLVADTPSLVSHAHKGSVLSQCFLIFLLNHRT